VVKWYNESTSREPSQEDEKNNKKVLKKVLTKGERCGIIIRLSARQRDSSLKIEQQRKDVLRKDSENSFEFFEKSSFK